MTLSVIIVHHKSRELLKLCLQSLAKYLPTEMETEILVVDSEAQSATEEMIREDFSSARYWPRKENSGYARGVNYGLQKAKGSWLLILNPDIIITPQSVSAMLRFMRDHPEVGLLGPRLLNFDGQIQNSRFRFYRPETILYRRTFLGKMAFGRNGLDDFNFKDEDQETTIYPDWLMGSALLTKKEAVAKVGLLDERFFLYFEDVDWAKRFWENGYKVVYFPQATMYHYHQRRSRAGLGTLDFFLRREARWHFKSAVKYFWKHGTSYQPGKELCQKKGFHADAQ